MKEYSQEQKDEMRERLKTIASRKFKTTMIYPLAQVEMEFGHLWGHGKPEANLTKEEKINKAKWERCRNNILNNGNRQMRGLMAEMDSHEVVWQRFTTTFTVQEGAGQ